MEEASLYSGYWKSIGHVLRDITNVVAVESGVIHPLLGYAGTLDLIAEYKGLLAVIDWKTSAKHKTNLKDCYSYPQQIAAYAGAVNYDKSYPFQVQLSYYSCSISFNSAQGQVAQKQIDANQGQQKSKSKLQVENPEETF